MNKVVKVSVLVPVFNGGQYIATTIDSLIEQTYSDFEIIVIDDGSTDDTQEVLRDYRDRIMILKQSNQGVSAARNLGASHAAGALLAFCDADDWWESDKLAAQIESLGHGKWSYTDSLYHGGLSLNARRRSDLSPSPAGNVWAELLLENFVTTSSVLLDREMFLAYGGFDTSLHALEDWDLWLRLAVDVPIKFHRAPLVHYRVHADSTSRRAREVLGLHEDVIYRALDNAVNRGYTQLELARLKRVALGKAYSVCAYIAEASNDHSFAILCTAKSLRCQPRKFELWKQLARRVLQLLTAPLSALAGS